ncbi:sel1 repeat family protein [Undibacterium sp. Jales W-56]|uniref:tetratricopeptide repeat protein n=1 Tax=Undibacterium sp. Jales W-56 TaxID=2897325 RepID=UPI0021D20165|nr:tetratricopeptide repeat protein [Undibacterium sp. Jales W-56]MCU6435198.1 sel1 repeat family protein [Undibacterium sp. Jales W-56]
MLPSCSQKLAATPTNAEIESVGLTALHGRDPVSIQMLLKWAEQGHMVAGRELGLVYSAMPQKQAEAAYWLEQAAKAGDSEAAFLFAEALYKGTLSLKPNSLQAWKWYELSANKDNAKASFMLARMAKYGEGIAKDIVLSVQWLKKASEQGNAQAMFLLSNAYASGEGVNVDPVKAREWLERSAEADYPVAIQALAMELDGGEHQKTDDALRARHLIKEASDERLLRWNKYQ